MLTKSEAFFRILIAIMLFTLSGTGTVNGIYATMCGILGTIELATAVLRYSPLMDLLDRISILKSLSKIKIFKSIKE